MADENKAISFSNKSIFIFLQKKFIGFLIRKIYFILYSRQHITNDQTQIEIKTTAIHRNRT